jgi:hypothetical protein
MSPTDKKTSHTQIAIPTAPGCICQRDQSRNGFPPKIGLLCGRGGPK